MIPVLGCSVEIIHVSWLSLSPLLTYIIIAELMISMCKIPLLKRMMHQAWLLGTIKTKVVCLSISSWLLSSIVAFSYHNHCESISRDKKLSRNRVVTVSDIKCIGTCLVSCLLISLFFILSICLLFFLSIFRLRGTVAQCLEPRREWVLSFIIITISIAISIITTWRLMVLC